MFKESSRQETPSSLDSREFREMSRDVSEDITTSVEITMGSGDQSQTSFTIAHLAP